MSHRNDRTLAVRALARVEGEGAMHVRVRGGAVEDVRLKIYEPPRFFEAFLRGRRHAEPPDITARICGICPVAYQMSACLAIEAACGIEVTAPIADLGRRAGAEPGRRQCRWGPWPSRAGSASRRRSLPTSTCANSADAAGRQRGSW